MEEDLFRVGLDFGVEPIMKKEEETPSEKQPEEQLTLSDEELLAPEQKVEESEKEKEVEEEAEEQPETPVEEEQEEEISPSMLVYNFLRENELSPEVEDFDGSPEKLREVLSSLPDVYMGEALNTMHRDARVLLQYAYELGEGGDISALKAFFDEYYEPQLTEYDITTEDGARAYLGDMFRRKNVYDSSEDINNALDMLADQNKVIPLAQKNYTTEKEELDKRAATKAVEEAQRRTLQQESIRKQQEAIRTELDSLPWSTERKKEVALNLIPKIANEKTQAIMKSPRAIIQLADFYAYFDPKKGEFDLDALIKERAGSMDAKEKKKNIEKDTFSSSLARVKGKSPKTKTAAKTSSYLPKIDFSDEQTQEKIFLSNDRT